MKFIHFFFTVIFFVELLSSCSGNVHVEIPDNLIGQEKMEAILYDAIIMDSMSTFSNKNPTKIKKKPFINEPMIASSLKKLTILLGKDGKPSIFLLL